jgi:Ca2+-transporting ATPase
MIGLQIMFIFVGGSAISITPLSWVQWCYSVILAALCIPFGIVVRLIPDELVERICQRFSRRQGLPAIDEEQQVQSPP